jgi:hypothetical protein
MRVLRLAELAGRAELLRLRALAQRSAGRAAVAAVAGAFGVAALVTAHVAVWLAATRYLSAVETATAMAAGDAVVAVILLRVAALNRPSNGERQAMLLREAAWDGVRREAALADLLAAGLELLRRPR